MWLYNAFFHSDDCQKNTSSHIIVTSDRFVLTMVQASSSCSFLLIYMIRD